MPTRSGVRMRITGNFNENEQKFLTRTGEQSPAWDPEHLILQNQFRKHSNSLLLSGLNIGEVAVVYAYTSWFC